MYIFLYIDDSNTIYHTHANNGNTHTYTVRRTPVIHTRTLTYCTARCRAARWTPKERTAS